MLKDRRKRACLVRTEVVGGIHIGCVLWVLGNAEIVVELDA